MFCWAAVVMGKLPAEAKARAFDRAKKTGQYCKPVFFVGKVTKVMPPLAALYRAVDGGEKRLLCITLTPL